MSLKQKFRPYSVLVVLRTSQASETVHTKAAKNDGHCFLNQKGLANFYTKTLKFERQRFLTQKGLASLYNKTLKFEDQCFLTMTDTWPGEVVPFVKTGFFQLERSGAKLLVKKSRRKHGGRDDEAKIEEREAEIEESRDRREMGKLSEGSEENEAEGSRKEEKRQEARDWSKRKKQSKQG